jgi:hypothetical protein
MRMTKASKHLQPWPLALAVIGTVLAVFSLIDLLQNPAPFTSFNEKIIADMANANALPVDLRMQLLMRLRDEQEDALTGKPAEPFAWARLAWLRLATGDDRAHAFAALRLSDQISPGEPDQLPERALMWRQFRAVENRDEQDYQTELWQKAFRLDPERTWKIAAQNGLTGEAGDAIKADDAEQYEEWKARDNPVH